MSDQQHAHGDEDAGLNAEPDVPAEPAIDIPEDPAEAVPVLMEALMAAKAAASENLDHWQRTSAEFDNFRKRAHRDQQAMVDRAGERVLSELLPTLDSFDAAIAFEAETETEQKLLAGMHGTRTQLLASLAASGLEPIESLGMVFDPERHEAVQVAEGSGTMVVTAELRRGYLLNGRVIRAALVAVGYEEGGAEA